MAQDTTEVRIAKTGRILTAAVGTQAPADISAEFSATWKDHGLTTPDGVTLTPTTDKLEVEAWQLDAAALSTITKRSFAVKFTLIQAVGDNTVLAFGGGTWTGSGGKYKYTPPSGGDADDRMLAVEWEYGTIKKRFISPTGSITAVGDVALNKQGATAYDLTYDVVGDDWYLQSNDADDAPAA